MTPIRGPHGIAGYDIKVLSAKEKQQVKEEAAEEAPPVEFYDAGLAGTRPNAGVLG